MNGNLSDKEARFLEKARQALLASEGRLDAATLARLREARAKAVEAAGERSRGFFRVPNWMRAGAFATAAAAVILFAVWMDPPKQELPVKSVDEFEIVLYADNLELYEDMDFYEWLADVGNGGSST
jgi:ferric-dicitrate binding protein FerR (iron transport regulator)